MRSLAEVQRHLFILAQFYPRGYNRLCNHAVKSCNFSIKKVTHHNSCFSQFFGAPNVEVSFEAGNVGEPANCKLTLNDLHELHVPDDGQNRMVELADDKLFKMVKVIDQNHIWINKKKTDIADEKQQEEERRRGMLAVI